MNKLNDKIILRQAGYSILYINVILLFLFLPTHVDGEINATISADQSSTIVIKFDQVLNSYTISGEDVQITRRYFDNNEVKEDNIAVDEIDAAENQISIRLFPLSRSGILQIAYKPGKWEYSDGRIIDSFSVTVRNRSALIEDWDHLFFRRWIGPNFWANRLQDWEIVNGVLECGVRIDDFPMPMRTMHNITREVYAESGDEFHLAIQVRGIISCVKAGKYMVGFVIGAGGGWLDYRAGAIVQSYSGLGGGILCLVDFANNQLTFRDNNDEQGVDVYPVSKGVEQIHGEMSLSSCNEDILLELAVKKQPTNNFSLTLTGWDFETGSFLGSAVLKELSRQDITGSFAIVAHPGGSGFCVPIGFTDFRCWGSMLKSHPKREFGPIVGTLYSLNKGVMKMSVQFMPVAWPGNFSDRFPQPLVAELEYREKGVSTWQRIEPVRITQPEYIAHFRVENWDNLTNHEYRITFEDKFGIIHHYAGMIRKDPQDKAEVSLVALTGMGVMGRRADSRTPGEGTKVVRQALAGRWAPSNVWFPHSEIVSNIKVQDPDILFFTGDQIYENNPTKPDRRDRFPELDYLYKLYLWYWSFREITKDRPAILQIDDHDVYAGNVWGHSGKLNVTGLNSDGGGYMVDPLFIQMVERTQCWHNPDPYRLTEPLKNSLNSYFTSFSYGGISFAVLEDRKFKTPPPRESYIPHDEVLLGEPQLRFLEEWLDDWYNAHIKIVISQSTYASTHTDWGDGGLHDYDTGGYPKSGRDRALEVFRKARALIICGDQHLATITRMGIEKPGDAGLQFCVPAVGNIYWRWFFPEELLEQWEVGDLTEIPDVSGDYRDEFGNYFRMITVANPDHPGVIKLGRSEAWAPRTDDIITKRVSRGDGYGRVIIDKSNQLITLQCFPFDADLTDGDNSQFPGWPKTISFDALEGRAPVGYLPELRFIGIKEPVIQVINEADGDIVYVIRVGSQTYCPPVFTKGTYTVRVFESENIEDEVLYHKLKPQEKPGLKKINVKL